MAKKTTRKRTPNKPWHVLYNLGCSPMVTKFRTKTEMQKFIAEFDTTCEDNWIDFTFKGSVLKYFGHYKFE